MVTNLIIFVSFLCVEFSAIGSCERIQFGTL